MSPWDIETILYRADLASAGPFYTEREGPFWNVRRGIRGRPVAKCDHRDDAELLAHAQADIRTLVQALINAQARIETLETAVQEIHAGLGPTYAAAQVNTDLINRLTLEADVARCESCRAGGSPYHRCARHEAATKEIFP